MNDRANKSITISLIVLSLVLATVIAGLVRVSVTNQTKIDNPVRADARDYFTYAYNIKNYGIYSRTFAESESPPDAVRSPGYPLFLTLFIDRLPTQGTVERIKLTQAIIGAVVVLLSGLVFFRMMSGFFALSAMALTLFSPHLISAGTYVLTETLFSLLCIILVLLSILSLKRPSTFLLLNIGAVLGLATLMRPSLQYFVVAYLVFFVFHFGLKSGFRQTVLITVAFLVIYSPWLVRNQISIGHTTDPTLKISFLLHGMYPDFEYKNDPKTFGFPYRFDPRSDEIGKDVGSVLNEIFTRFKNEPIRHLEWFFFKKPVVLWGWDTVNGYGDVFVYPPVASPYLSYGFHHTTHAVMKAIHPIIIALSLLGALVVWFPIRVLHVSLHSLYAARFASIFLMYFLALHIVGAPFPRYSIPLRPITYGLFAYCIYLAYTSYMARQNSEIDCVV